MVGRSRHSPSVAVSFRRTSRRRFRSYCCGSGKEQPRDFNGAGATNGDTHPVTEERPPASAEDKKESTTIPGALPPPRPVTAPGADTGGQEPRLGMPWPALDYSQGCDEVEKELLQRMCAKYGGTLVTDLDDAQLLLSYVTRNGLQEDRKVSDETIQTLIAAREHVRKFSFDSEKEEANFRKSCGIIAKAADPVTAASLRDSTHNRAIPPLDLHRTAATPDRRDCLPAISRAAHRGPALPPGLSNLLDRIVFGPKQDRRPNRGNQRPDGDGRPAEARGGGRRLRPHPRRRRRHQFRTKPRGRHGKPR